MSAPTRRQVLELVRAVSDSNPLLLDAQKRAMRGAHGGPMFASPEYAVASGNAFTVEPREGVIALDVDTVDGALPSWLEGVKAFCADLSCPLVEVTSGGASGGRHLWIRTPVGWSNAEFAQRLRQEVPGLQAKGQRQQVRHTQATRPPLSVHPSGAQPQLLSPATVPEALAVLIGPRPFQSAGVSERVRQLLREGAAKGQRTSAVLTIALSYVNAGLSQQAFRQALEDPAHQAGQVLREMPPSARQKALKAAWTKACQLVRENPCVEGENTRRLLAALSAAAERFPFSARHTTDRLVFAYLVSLTARSGRAEVTCSTRLLAEEIGRSRKAVGDALKRLRTEHELVKLVEVGRGLEASRWQLLPKDTQGLPTSYPLGGTENSSGEPSRAFGPQGLHHAFGGSGLPAGAGPLWDAMSTEVDRYTVTQLLELVPGLSRATVLQYLHALHSAGLVEPNKPRGHYWTKLPALESKLDRLAQGNGNAKRAKRLREQHALERAVYERRRTSDDRGPLKRPCSGATQAGAPCRGWGLPTGPSTRAEHCHRHASQQELDLWRSWRDAKAPPQRQALAA